MNSEIEMKEKLPGPSAAFALFLLASLLNVLLSTFFFSISEDLGIVAAEPLAILVPTLLVVRLLGLDIRKSLRLKLPSGTDLLLALPLAFSLTVLNDQISNLVGQVYPLPDQLQEGMARLLRAENAYDWLIRILGIGLGAAISEECLFRGFIQRGLERGLSRSTGVVLTALLFGLMHLIPQGIPSYFFAGLVLGTTALATESILIPVVLHFIYNLSAVSLLSYYGIETLGRPVWIPASFLIPALMVFLLTFGHFVRKAAGSPRARPSLPLTSSGTDHLTPTSSSPHLSAIDPRRRRLGWLTVGCAVACGTIFILSLFALTLYKAHTQAIHSALIETMRQDVLRSLPPPASLREAQINQAFDSLEAINRAGRLSLIQVGSLNWLLVQARADGSVTRQEIDAIVEEIRAVVRAGTPIRRL